MKKFIIFIILSIITQKAISKNWELDKNGINYNQAISENLTLPNEITKPNIYIYDDFNTPLDSGTTHGGFVLGLMKKISNFQEIREEVPFSSEDFEISLVSDFLGETNIVNLSYKTDFTGYAGVNIYHGFNKHNYIVTTAANENSSNNNDLCFNEDVICVAATNSSGIKTYYSGYGENVDIAAPGGEKNTNRFKDLKDLQKIFPRLDLVYDGFYLYENINGLYININETYSNQQYNKKAMLLNNQPVLTKLALAYAINKVNNNNKYTIIDELTGNYNQNLPNISHIKFVNAIKTISNLPNNPEPLYVNGYTEEGTSFAAPYVTITLANILEKLSESSELKDISREQVLDLLYMSGDYVPTFDNYSTCQNINNILNIGEVTNGIYTQNLSLINNPTICNAAKIRIPRKINFYQSLYNASFVLPTTIKTTGESDILSNSTSLREFSEDGGIWGAYRKPNELDVVEINHNLLVDEDLKAKNLTIDQGVTVNFNYDIDVSVGNMFDNQGIIEGCFSDTCNHIGSLEFTGKTSYFKNEGSVDIDSGSAGIYQGGGELIVKDSCSASLKNPEGEITVLYNENSCQLKAKKITYKPTEFNISRHNINNFNISGEHYKKDSLVVLDNSDSSNFNGYNTNYFDVYKLILNDNLDISGKFSTKTMFTYPNNQEIFNISSIEGYNYDIGEWQLDNLFFDELTLRSTIINTYQANNIYASDFYFINSEINGEPSLFVNYFVNRGSILNLSNLTVLGSEENKDFKFINIGELNISDTLKLEELGEIKASDFVSNNYNINKLHIGKGTHLKIDVNLEIGDLQLDNNSSIEILENKTLNIKNITSTNQLNDVNNNSLIYGDGFIGINNFYCTSNRVTDFGDVNVSFYTAKFGSSTNSCTVIADKVNFVSFQNNPSKSSAYGTINIGSSTNKTDLYFNSDFNYSAINFTMLNETADTFVNSNSTIKELRMKKGKIFNNGTLNAAKIRTSIGSFFEGNEINNTGYIVFEGNEIIFDEDIKVNKPYFTNNTSNPIVDIAANIHFNHIVQNLTINSENSISEHTFTIEGMCNKTINYENGIVNLENIKLYDKVGGRYPKKPCEVNANTVNLNSFDLTYDQKDLYGNINNLNIYTQSNDDIQIGIVGNLNNYSTNLKLSSGSSVDGDINNFGSVIITSSLTHLNGYLNNNGTLQVSTLKTNVLGNRTGNSLILNATSISGQGEVNTLGTGTVENLSAGQNDYVVLNHDFTFINPRVHNFQGTHNAYFEGRCSGYYNYPEGQIYLNNIKMERHAPNSYYSRSIGCDLTTGDVFLQSYDETFNNRNLLVHGNLYVETSNESDSIMFQIDSGNLFIDNNSIFNVESGSSIDTELMQISSGSNLLSTGGIKIYDTDVINDGEIEVSTIYASRIGHFDFEKLINTGSYSLEGDSDGRITVESAVEIDNLRLSNTDDIIVLDHPLIVNNMNSKLRFEGTEILTVKGLCRNELYFETGTIELSDIKLQRHAPTSYYTPSHGCLIEAKNTHLVSLDPEYDSRELFIKGNLVVFNTNEDLITLNISEGNLILNDNVDFKLTSTAYLDTDLIQVNQGSRLYVNGGIKSYDSDFILNGSVEASYIETSRLGHIDGSKLNVSSYIVSGYENGIVIVESEGFIDNIRMANSDDIIMMNYPFRFNGTNSTLRFEGDSLVTISDLCKNEILYETGNVDLVNVKLQLHRLNAPYGSNATHGCLVTAVNINLQSMDEEYNSVDLITNGTLNINSVSNDEIKIIANGDVNISSGSLLALSNYSEFNSIDVNISGNVIAKTIKIPTSNINIQNGFLDSLSLQTERLGHIEGYENFNTQYYTIINKSEVITESASKVNNLVAHGGNLKVNMTHNFEFNNTATNLELVGNAIATLSGDCKRETNYQGGTVNLHNIRFLNPKNGIECHIEANTINLNSFDSSYAQRKLKSFGNLYINGSYTNTNYLQFDHTGYASVNSTLNIWYTSNFNNRLDIFGHVNFKLGSYSHTGYLSNHGGLVLDSRKYLIINGTLEGTGYYQVEECRFKLNGTTYKFPTDLTECD